MSTITLAFSKILETVCKNRKINYVRLMTKSGIHVHSLTNKQTKKDPTTTPFEGTESNRKQAESGGG